MNVLTAVLEEKGQMEFMKFSMKLDLMRMYGPEIWLGYKDYCNQDIDDYFESVMNNDDDLREYVENYPDNVT